MDNKTITRALKGDPDAAAECTAAGVAINCPFCGGKAHTGHHNSGNKDDEYFLVMCAFCFARTVGATVGEAIGAWNRRVRMED